MSLVLNVPEPGCVLCAEDGVVYQGGTMDVCNMHRFLLWALDEVVASDQWTVFRAIWPNRKTGGSKEAGPAIRAALKGMERGGVVARVPKRGWIRTAEGTKMLVINAPPVAKHPPRRERVGTHVIGDEVSFPWPGGYAKCVLPTGLATRKCSMFRLKGTNKIVVLWPGSVCEVAPGSVLKEIELETL